jgi:flagellar biosynthetic protein FliQ
MTPQMVMDLGKDAMLLVLLTAAPMLLASLLTGLLVSIFQAVTQIHEMTLTFVPKIIASFLVLVIFAPWMLRMLVDFTANLLMNLGMYTR